ncbi:MAG: bifunctional hydroxymethylpyrimidine kinase/phosphomethylpyrimidine kinase [Pseudomonadota bacterium]
MIEAVPDFPRILTIAGSDSGGGAGIQADLKTITQLGGFGMSAVTAITAQNTLGVHAVHAIPSDIVSRQIDVVLDDLGADAIKIGMLKSSDIIEAVAASLGRHSAVPVILDPVMVATSGDRLLDSAAVASLKRDLFVRADLITPNAPEASFLTGRELTSIDDAWRAAEMLVTLGAGAVLIKGGHGFGASRERVTDVFFDGSEFQSFEAARLDSRNTHGTGCTLSAAIATFLGSGKPLIEAVSLGIDYVRQAIATAPALGQGAGPLRHWAPGTQS